MSTICEMSCKYWIFPLLIALLGIHGTNGICTIPEKRHLSAFERSTLECSSVDQEEFQKYIDDYGSDFNELILRNTTVPVDEILPFYSRMRIKWLTITDSNLTRPVFMDRNLLHLDLSFNNIEELDDNSLMPYEVILHHNQIKFFNGSQVSDSNPLKILDLSYNKIKHFTKLEKKILVSLNLSHNLIREIGDSLSVLEEIGTLDLSYNELRKISASSFGHFTYLGSLNLSHNDIFTVQYDAQNFPKGKSVFWKMYRNYNEFADLSFNKIHLSNGTFRGAVSTKVINLENNGLKDLNFLISKESENIRGQALIFRNNKIKKLHPYTFNGFRLNKLDLSYNKIELILPLSFKGLSLEELNLAKNNIVSLESSTFSDLPSLQRLNLSLNPLTNIQGGSLSILRLRSLDLSHCLLSEVPSDLVKNLLLDEIYLNHNKIESLERNSFPIVGNDEMRRLQTEYNSRYSSQSLPTLKILDLSHNLIRNLESNVFSGLIISDFLSLAHNPIESLEYVFNNTKINNVKLTGISLSKLSQKDVKGLISAKYLNFSNIGIQELSNNTFDQLSSLKTLSLDDNSIQIIPSNFFGFNKQLKSLSIVRNPISVIHRDSFPHLMGLENLSLTLNGEILEKRFVNLMFLKELHILHSVVSKISKNSFRGLGRLISLNFENSTVLSIEPGAFEGLRNVKQLDERNLFAKITKLEPKMFVGLKSLESLNFSYMGIENIEDGAFEGLDSLVNLNFSHSKIRQLSRNAFIGLKKLKILDLSFNDMNNFPIFSDLVELTELHLEYNRFDGFERGTFSNLENLRFLNLSHNLLRTQSDLILFPLKKLDVLDINSNGLSFIRCTLLGSTIGSNIRLVGIGDNNFMCSHLPEILKCFDDHSINYTEISHACFPDRNVRGICCS